MHQAFQIRAGQIFKAEKPVRNPLYLRFVKRFACAACGSTKLVDPAHTGEHAYGRKGSDTLAIPLCRKCHDLFDADPRGFALRRHLNIPALIRKFNHLWEQKLRRTA